MTDTAPATRTPPAEAWDDAPRAPSEPGPPVLAVDGFEGPLDWLVEQSRTGRIDLARLSILALVEAFGAALEAALARRTGEDPFDLARWAGWTTMAAQLTLLRSRLLRPTETDEARRGEDDAEAWRGRVLDRAETLRAADWLERRPRLGQEVFARGQAEPGGAGQGGGTSANVGESAAPAEDADVTALFRACLIALRLPQPVEAYQPRPRVWGIGDAVAHITEQLGVVPDGSTLAVFLPPVTTGMAEAEDPAERDNRARLGLAATFVASLELARQGALGLEQDAAWADVHLRRPEQALVKHPLRSAGPSGD